MNIMFLHKRFIYKIVPYILLQIGGDSFMNMVENIRNSFKYPFYNIKQWAILTILFIIGNIMIFTGLDTRYLGFDIIYPLVESYVEIFAIISVIVSIFVLGYTISILKKSHKKTDEMPSFNIKNNFINGLKHILISFVYLIIPLLIFIGLSFLMNVTNYGFDLQTFTFIKLTILNETADYVETYAQTAPPTLNVILTLLISFIVTLVFAIGEIIALCRLAETDSIKEAFNFKNIYTEFKQKGAKILIGIIIICIISTILGIIFAMINSSFASGIIISVIGYAYLTILNYRFIGLLYNP